MRETKHEMIRSLLVLKACGNAMKAQDMRNKHGAVICYEKKGLVKIVSSGYNKKGRYNDFLTPCEYSLHAEMDCLRNFGNKLDRHALRLVGKKFEMLVVRFKNGKLMNSKPCGVCMAMLEDSMLETISYSDEYGNIRRINLKEVRNKNNMEEM